MFPAVPAPGSNPAGAEDTAPAPGTDGPADRRRVGMFTLPCTPPGDDHQPVKRASGFNTDFNTDFSTDFNSVTPPPHG
ncbi:hypothetical protein [Streptomyces marianii]|uniref:Uncharacterized protein n=1 Tax=Streptomyces marianii TaxID=1817406 RepID=A0A5R9EG69_9ACTN|nr:hypothetical protein [Streptomyces marianii]TLQ46883.1 hypothetical protein FEF34_31450 [Streptomyces marianii]